MIKVLPKVIEVVGMGADGPVSCTEAGRRALADAEVILGGRRHLDLVAGLGAAELVEWPSPLRERLPGLLAGYAGRRVAVVATGDPLVAGIGGTLIDLVGADRVRVHPAVSSVALARARLGWPAEGVEVLRVGAGEGVDRLRRLLTPGRRILVLSADETSPAQVAAVCWEVGLPGARLVVLGNLGAADETRHETTATALAVDGTAGIPRLNVVAVELPCTNSRNRGVHPHSSDQPPAERSFGHHPGPTPRPIAGWLAPGLPDDAYEHDGQLTKRHLRAAALAVLQPTPGELLWDLGAGSGSIGIEWARLHAANRACAIEQNPTRAERIARNAAHLGVHLDIRTGAAHDLITDLPDPDAVFVGGGATRDLIDTCWRRLPTHGRLVVHGVTLETEGLLFDCHAAFGGELIQLSVSRAQPLGRYRGWAPARPVVQWAVTKSSTEEPS